jgi:L-alanine-DL-glutamate epimerase-like enolase superfamily enzyme
MSTARVAGLIGQEIVRPLRTTFSTSRGSKQHIHNIIVRARLDDGREGQGEIPTSFTYPDETIPEARKTLDIARAELKGLPVGECGPWIEAFRTRFPRAMMTVSGIETALFRAHLTQGSVSEHAWWGGKGSSIETDITIPILTDQALLERWLKWATRHGFRIYKLKVGGNAEADRALVSSVYRALEARVTDFRLRLDGNQGYDVGGFFDFVGYMEKEHYDVELFEQPFPKDDLASLEKTRGKSPMPIVLDEGVRSIEQAQRVIDNDLCHGINIKIAKSGIEGSRKIADLAKKHGKKLMVGCMTETMVGASAGMWMALGRGDIDYIDLDSPYLLYGSRRWEGLALRGPLIEVV